MSALATYISRAQLLLHNALTADYGDAPTMTEMVAQALAEYNLAVPMERETVVALPGDGREIALDALTGLHRVTEVYWPFDSLSEVWPPNRVRGWYLYFDDARPVLYLNSIEGNEPQLDDELRLWYSCDHTIENLNSATETTVDSDHESLIVMGAAGHAAYNRIVFLSEYSSADMFGAGLLATWAQRTLKTFRDKLNDLKRARARAGKPFPNEITGGWKMDKWEN